MEAPTGRAVVLALVLTVASLEATVPASPPVSLGIPVLDGLGVPSPVRVPAVRSLALERTSAVAVEAASPDFWPLHLLFLPLGVYVRVLGPSSTAQPETKATLVGEARALQQPSRRRVLATCIELAGALERSGTATGVRSHGAVAEGSSTVPATGPSAASVAHAGLGMASVAGRRDASTAFRDVGPWPVRLGPTGVASSAAAAIVRAIVRRQRIVGRAMAIGATA